MFLLVIWRGTLKEKQTFFLPHFLEVILSNKRDSRFGFVWCLLLHVDLKILLPVPERALLWAVLTTRRRTLQGYKKNQRQNAKMMKITVDEIVAPEAPEYFKKAK